jgi:hypothetical protein
VRTRLAAPNLHAAARALAVVSALAGGIAPLPTAAADIAAKPQRIVSLNMPAWLAAFDNRAGQDGAEGEAEDAYGHA